MEEIIAMTIKDHVTSVKGTMAYKKSVKNEHFDRGNKREEYFDLSQSYT